jgi:hypothetical protein
MQRYGVILADLRVLKYDDDDGQGAALAFQRAECCLPSSQDKPGLELACSRGKRRSKPEASRRPDLRENPAKRAEEVRTHSATPAARCLTLSARPPACK